MMLFIPLLLAKVPARKSRGLIGMGLIVLLLIPLDWNRLWVFSDNYRLWNDAALLLDSDREAGADRIFYNRGQAESAARKWDDATLDFQRAIVLSPQLGPLHYELGVAFANKGRNQDALVQFDTAIALKPDEANFYYAKGITLKRLHQDELAMHQIEKSCELKNLMACMIVQANSNKK
ncbi:MAG: tetratricopeptide repeat protein [Nitrosomonadales bacterium]